MLAGVRRPKAADLEPAALVPLAVVGRLEETVIEYMHRPLSELMERAQEKGLTLEYHPLEGCAFWLGERAVGWTTADHKEIARFIEDYEQPRRQLPVEELAAVAAKRGLRMEWDRALGATFWRSEDEVGWAWSQEQAQHFIERWPE
jgi:hypothetical protein